MFEIFVNATGKKPFYVLGKIQLLFWESYEVLKSTVLEKMGVLTLKFSIFSSILHFNLLAPELFF